MFDNEREVLAESLRGIQPAHVQTAAKRHGALVCCGPAGAELTDCEMIVDFADINPFVLALTDPNGYAVAFPDCDILNGDINADGKIDFGDINPFVNLLTGP